MNIAVIFGGISPERNVSIAGGKAVVKALKEKGHNVIPIDPAFGKNSFVDPDNIIIPQNPPSDEELNGYSPRNLIDCVNSELFDNVDVAFLVLHGKYGEDGIFQALLDLRGIPYTGSKVKASSVAIDKIASKVMFTAAGVPTPPWVTVHPYNINDYDFYKDLRAELGNKVVVKPNDQGSTIGITILESGNLDDIHKAIIEASKYSENVVVEQFIEGREITVGIVGDEALPIIEIVPEEGFYDYEHKYTKGKTEYICPADIDEDFTEFIQQLSIRAYNILGCSGFGRVDFRMDEDGQVYCLEVNTIPGFTATSLVPKAAAEIGVEFGDLCEEIISLALNSKIEQTENEISEEE